MIFSSFRKFETKNLNSDPRILISLYWKLYHQLHIGYLNIRSDHETEAAIHALHRLLLKTFAKLAEDFYIFIQEATIQRGKYEGEININLINLIRLY